MHIINETNDDLAYVVTQSGYVGRPDEVDIPTNATRVASGVVKPHSDHHFPAEEAGIGAPVYIRVKATATNEDSKVKIIFT